MITAQKYAYCKCFKISPPKKVLMFYPVATLDRKECTDGAHARANIAAAEYSKAATSLAFNMKTQNWQECIQVKTV